MKYFSPAHVAAGYRYVVGYSPGCYSIRDAKSGAVLSEHKSKRDARRALKRLRADDARGAVCGDNPKI